MLLMLLAVVIVWSHICAKRAGHSQAPWSYFHMPNNVRVTWKLHFSQRDVIYLVLITATCPGCPVFKNIQIAIESS
jgi:hypothetical protein